MTDTPESPPAGTEAEQALAYLSGLEMTLVEVSNQFIRAQPDDTDRVITEAIARVGQYCDVDRSYVFRLDPANDAMNNTQEWCAEGISSQMAHLQGVPTQAAPRMMERLRAGEAVHIRQVDKLPASWQAEREILEPQQIQSLVAVPIMLGDQLLGFIGFDSVDRTRKWRGEEIRVLRLLGDLAGGMLERSRTEVELRQTAAVFESTAEGAFITDTDGAILDVNRAFTEITGFTPNDVRGRNPRLLQSGRHTRDFYQQMWASLGEAGQWRGEIWNRRRNGEIYPAWLTASAVRNSAGDTTHYVAVFSDITNVKNAEERLDFLAHHDPLTHLPNRLLLNARLEHALRRASRSKQPMAVLFLDLDRFKDVNDSLGHPIGDRLLQAVAERLAAQVRQDDTLARLGGDEFVVLLESIGSEDHVGPVAEKLLRSFETPFPIEGQDLYISASIGISLCPRDGMDSETLTRNADTALFKAKEQGRNDYAFYTEQLTRHAAERMELTHNLRRAIKEGQFQLAYQPQVDMANGRVAGVEALLRWEQPQLGNIAPDRFVPLAEDTGLILPIGTWVLESACRQARAWLDAGTPFERIAVNVASAQILRGDLVADVHAALESSGLPAARLELEVTESSFLSDATRAITVFRELRRAGVTVAIDDFGTGYSSLGQLRQLPVDRLKLDKTFVRDLPGNRDDLAIARTVIALGDGLGIPVIAEGVETEAQRDCLLGAGCRLGQGYLFGYPEPADRLSSLLQSRSTG